MKVVLVNLPQMMPVSWKAPEIFQPTGLAYLAAYLEAHDINVQIIDGNLGELAQQCDYYYSGIPIRELSRQIRTSTPDLVGISVLFSLTAKLGIELAKHLKCWDHDIPIVMGGAHPTVRPIEMLRTRAVDFVVLGEGEHALLNLVTMFEQGLLPESEGLAWMDGSVPEVHPIEDFISDLDTLPFPARHLLDMEAYFEAHDKGRSIPTLDRYWAQMITCFDEKTEILTKSGWKFFSDLKREDLVATLNPQTHFLGYQNPIRIISAPYEGIMYQISGKSIDLLVTPNHRLYIKGPASQKKESFELIEVSQIANKTDIEFKKDAHWSGRESEWFYLPAITYKENPIYGRKKITPRKLKMDDWLEFLGYYLSEGSCSRTSNCWKIKIDQSKERNPSVYSKIMNVIDRLGFNYYKNKNYLQISNKQLFKYLKKLGRSYEKFIPIEFKELSYRQLQILFDALILGDGSISKREQIQFISTSKKLIDDLQEITLKIGWSGYCFTRTRRENPMIKGRPIISRRPCYVLIVNQKQNTPRLTNLSHQQHITKEKYNGSVYCCEVPNGIIYVRRNGKTCWSGNSRGCPYKCIFCSIQPTHGRRFRPRSPENVVDEMEHLMDTYGVRFVNIEDDNVALSTNRFENICDLIMERDLDLQWANSNGMRADQITPEIAKKMVKAGCQSVQISPESGCQEVVTKIIKKRMDLETVPKAIKALREAGMETVYSSFVIGLPGESKEQIWHTLQYGKKLKKMGSEIWFNVAVPFHGTPLYKIASEAGYLNDQFDDMLGTWKGTMDTEDWTGREIEAFQQLGIWYGRSGRSKLRFLARLFLGGRFHEIREKLRWMRISDVKDFSCRYSC